MRELIKFSVLIPVYKTERYISSCIESVLNQTYKNFNIIIIDDGSPDNCPQICDNYADNYSNIHVIHKSNEGSMSARKVGIDYALTIEGNGADHFIIFLDSDDTLKYNALEIIKENIIKSSCDLFIFSADITENNKIIAPLTNNSFEGVITDKNEALRMIASEQYNELWRKAVRSPLFVKKDYKQYYHISMGEDLIQSLDLVKNAKKILITTDRLYNYESNPNSVTNSVTAENYKLKSTYRRIVYEFLNEQASWNASEKMWYEQLTQKFIAGEIRKIVYSMNRKDVYRIWDRIQNDDYYALFLKQMKVHRKVDCLTLFCIKHKKYFLLWILCKFKVLSRRLFCSGYCFIKFNQGAEK